MQIGVVAKLAFFHSVLLGVLRANWRRRRGEDVCEWGSHFGHLHSGGGDTINEQQQIGLLQMKMAKARVCFGGGVGNGFLPFLLSRFSRARPSSLIITAVMLTTASLCIILSFPPSSPPHPPLLLSLSATQLAFSALEQPFRKPIGTQIDLLSISL